MVDEKTHTLTALDMAAVSPGSAPRRCKDKGNMRNCYFNSDGANRMRHTFTEVPLTTWREGGWSPAGRSVLGGGGQRCWSLEGYYEDRSQNRQSETSPAFKALQLSLDLELP